MSVSRAMALRRNLLGIARRHASGGSWMSARWVEQTRRESGITFVDDPPSAPLSEDHEIGDSKCDFGNWFDKAEDVSTTQALGGLGAALGFCYFVYNVAVIDARKKPAAFTLREVPTMANDIPPEYSEYSTRNN